jgi:predicted nucleic acid-binding protein
MHFIDDALKARWKDFEDAIHYQAAKAAGCDAIITRNAKDFKKADLPILSPQEFLDQLKSSDKE